MGRIRTKDIKNLTFGLIEAYPEKFVTDFERNKDELNQLNLIKHKRVRNKVAGYLARVVKRMQQPAAITSEETSHETIE